MPKDGRQPLWKPTRDRQDFSEELYVNVTYGLDPIEYAVKITVDTTAGSFELPNYWNGEKPGPLLPQQPECREDQNCEHQYTEYDPLTRILPVLHRSHNYPRDID